ncbi:hypothetical protein Tco_0328303 [Tanacetum coccineum]
MAFNTPSPLPLLLVSFHGNLLKAHEIRACVAFHNVFFLGKRVAYPVVANYVRNTWGKYGLVKSMLNSSSGIFSFQFSSIDGLDADPDVNLLKEDVVNVSIWVKLHGVPVTTFSEDGLSIIVTKLALIEVRADVELKDTILVVMPKLDGEGFYTCYVRVEYEWKPPRCVCCKIFGHVQDKCPKNIDSEVVSKKYIVNTSDNKKKDVEPTIEVSNLNPFDVLNSVENDVDFGTNGGTPNLASRKANSSGSLSRNVEFSSTSTTPMVEKINKIERLIIEGKVTLVDDKGKPLTKVDSSGDHDSEDEVASIDNDMVNFVASKKDGCGQDIPDKIQDICDNFDITVRGPPLPQRVAEALAAAVVTHAASTQEENNLGSNSSQNKTCNYKEFRAVMWNG